MNMRNKIELVLLIGLIGFSFSCIKGIEPEEYAVYSVVLKEHYSSPTKHLIVHQQTNPMGDKYFPTKRFFSEIIAANTSVHFDPSLAEDLIKKCKWTLKLEYNFSNVTVYLLTKQEENYDDNWTWKYFYKQHPEADYPDTPGIIYLTRVGFNQNHTQALLYCSNQSGEVAGRGYLFLLDKNNGKWQIKEKWLIMVS
jgi:hypothetical protein